MLKKSKAPLLNSCYDHPKTIPLIFHFQESLAPKKRLEKSQITKTPYCTLIDNYFTEEEANAFRHFSETATFSRDIFGSPESKAAGEKPARAMNSQEKWKFFNNPPEPIQRLYELFGYLGLRDGYQVMTLPWELTDGTISSPCMATNYLTYMSAQSMELGKHADYTPEKGLAFGIPKTSGDYFTKPFVNGSPGMPKMLTVMLYSTGENFNSDCGMGTVFYNNDQVAEIAECKHMRLCLFKGDIVHNIEASKNANTYRISYVFKLIFSPLMTIS